MYVRLADDLFVVGGGVINGFALSTSADCHVYAFRSGEEILLVDCGMDDDGGLDAIWANMREAGLDPARISTVAITHYHVDHCGGIGRLLERVDARVLASEETLAAIRVGDTEANAFALAQREGFYPEDYRFAAAPDLVAAPAGRPIPVGRSEVTPIPTPGHCAGHMAYMTDGRLGRYLFTGDCLFHGGRISLLNTADCSLAEYRTTIAKLAALEFDALLPGHGAVAMSHGADHAAAAAKAFESLTLPPSMT
jgi:hydroxyacylglutathione hydrolase